MPNTPCDIVIVNYNAGDHLLTCVGLALVEDPASVIVVDNHSADNSMARLNSVYGSHPALRTIFNEANLGFAAACNIGFAAGRQPLTLFLNPDAFLSPGSLGRMTGVLLSSESAGMAGGYLSYPDGSEQPGGRRAIPTPWRGLLRTLGFSQLGGRWPRLFAAGQLHLLPLPEQPVEVEAISGACMLVKRQLLNEVGCWDEGYFLHGEDLDLAMRFRQQGWKILFVPDAPVTHLHGACSNDCRLSVEWHKHRGMLRFYRKFFRQYPILLLGLIHMGVGIRFIMVMLRYGMKQLASRLEIRRN